MWSIFEIKRQASCYNSIPGPEDNCGIHRSLNVDSSENTHETLACHAAPDRRQACLLMPLLLHTLAIGSQAHLYVGHRSDTHFLAQKPIAARIDAGELHVHFIALGKLSRCLLELFLDRLGSFAESFAELDYYERAGPGGGQQLRQFRLVSHGLRGAIVRGYRDGGVRKR